MQNGLTEKRLTPELMYADIPGFMNQIFQLCALLELDLTAYEMDHIAMRLNDIDQARAAHQAWKKRGLVISESLIHGRPIIVIELFQPVNLGHWQTGYLELPYPVEGKSYPVEGWEHVEFVIPSKASSAEDFYAELCQKFPQIEENTGKHQIKVKLSSPQGEDERLANPTVAFKWKNVCVKLHPHSLKDVISSERNLLR
ncbi:hypothetical protein VA7868_04068 [Vibrio aerogenes CECT 7868]|uniref:VOC family protein n=1 Tax=Vibrio aerogenes CECT 7868 TaxID=1216006 RepID=A0A1M6CU54_9VIBR|nr:VOC family protein [Vibrio aerogenes]SHI64547.1 hypothetical protein VA7868_04068 [Vibrio aerogenes CECT 7868]